MPTLDSNTDCSNVSQASAAPRWGRRTFLILAGALLFFWAGCSKDPGMAAVETDANGYFCQKCQAKLFTDRKVFLENCPKCGENGLVNVIGYWCEKDQHLTLRPQISGPEGAGICEKCGVPLRNAMVSPREKDLLAWGATKVQKH